MAESNSQKRECVVVKAGLLVLVILVALTSPLFAAGRPMTVDDLLAIKGVSDPQFSPDGSLVVYVVSELDRATDKTNSSLWIVPVSGSAPKQMTTTPGTNNHPRFSPDGKTIAFVSSRGGSGQVWLLPVDGGEPRQLTRLPVEISGPIWSPRGDKIAVTASVYPGQSPDQTAARDKEKEAAKSKVRTYDRLMIRHWNAWDEGKRSHLFVVDAQTGEARDLTPKLDVNTPPAPFGGSSDYAWSPDGKELAFTAEPVQDGAWSTNTDIWTVPAEGGEPVNQTADNHGADAQPAYSPDGKWLAYVSQVRAGFESDLWVLKVRNRASRTSFEISRALDRPVQSFAWGPKPNQIVAIIDDSGTEPVVSIEFEVAADGTAAPTGATVANVPRLVAGGAQSAVTADPKSGRVVAVHHTVANPPELFVSHTDGSEPSPLTRHNGPLVAQLDLAFFEGFSFPGADGEPVFGWLLRPPGFDPGKKYPVIFLIHGGPQGAWHDEWHNRWSYQMFAAPGYVVVAINPRGSTGYGQKFTDQISQDWTGRVYDDLMKGLDHVLKKYEFVDAQRIGACGGSYGGFMVNWIAGHSERFRALVSHAGVFDLTSKYGTTEELWFPEWEFGGPPWEKPEHYRERSPSGSVANFKTPTLVIHGALDFRVPDAQGLGMFTSLQRRGVPSRFVWFPDEGHWIQKPQNRVVWWNEVLAWLDKYLKH
jgi:dipeptidyl aminopeptidase/acylaminoacyl peptidase